MTTKIAINGFGRIGRAAYKIIQDKEGVEVVAINDLTDPETLAHLLRYDTVYGKFDRGIKFENGYLLTNDSKALVLNERDPLKLPWKDLGIDVVLECTGAFVKDGASKMHIEAGARKVVVSAPTKGSGDVKTYLMGVNVDKYPGDDVISNASCTTNCIAPAIAIIHSALGVKKAIMTTVHAYTSTQNLVDGPHKDLRRARAAAQNIIPTTTGAAVATTRVIPELENKFDGLALRVPVPTGSLADITMVVGKETTVEEINNIFEEAKTKEQYKGILETTREPIVSSDVVKTTYSSIVDLSMTMVVGSDLVKILTWYDNEWGYSNRLVEIAMVIANKV